MDLPVGGRDDGLASRPPLGDWTTIFSYAAEFTKGIVNSVAFLASTVVKASIIPMKIVILFLGLSVLVEVGAVIMNYFWRLWLLQHGNHVGDPIIVR